MILFPPSHVQFFAMFAFFGPRQGVSQSDISFSPSYQWVAIFRIPPGGVSKQLFFQDYFFLATLIFLFPIQKSYFIYPSKNSAALSLLQFWELVVASIWPE